MVTWSITKASWPVEVFQTFRPLLLIAISRLPSGLNWIGSVSGRGVFNWMVICPVCQIPDFYPRLTLIRCYYGHKTANGYHWPQKAYHPLSGISNSKRCTNFVQRYPRFQPPDFCWHKVSSKAASRLMKRLNYLCLRALVQLDNIKLRGRQDIPDFNRVLVIDGKQSTIWWEWKNPGTALSFISC